MSKKDIKKYIETNDENNFVELSKEFWNNPNINSNELKAKYGINNKISFSGIIISYPTEEFFNFLNMYYTTKEDIKTVISKFNIPQNKINELVIPLQTTNYDRYCPNCYNNSFNIKRIFNNSDLIEQFVFICDKCNSVHKYLDLLNEQEFNKTLEELLTKINKFQNEINEIENKLKDVFCPQCQSNLHLYVNDKYFSYDIKCNNCDYYSKDINKTINDFKLYRHKTDILENISIMENKLISNILEKKYLSNIKYITEDIITFIDNQETIEYMYVTLKNKEDLWEKLYVNITNCIRLEKKILLEICNIVKNNGNIINLELDNKVNVEFYKYVSDSPIVYDLIEKTKIIIIRKVLRKLMSFRLIIVVEDENYIYIPKIIIDNIDKLEKMLFTVNIDGAIKHLIYERQNYACFICGEDGRPLKIAFTSGIKNYNDLNNMIGLCDKCHEVMTEDDVLIDISLAKLNKKEEMPKSFLFVLQTYPDLKDNLEIENELRNMEIKYQTSNVIKALTITIDKMENKKIKPTVDTLIKYTFGILKCIDTGMDIIVKDSLENKYNLKKWLI